MRRCVSSNTPSLPPVIVTPDTSTLLEVMVIAGPDVHTNVPPSSRVRRPTVTPPVTSMVTVGSHTTSPPTARAASSSGRVEITGVPSWCDDEDRLGCDGQRGPGGRRQVLQCVRVGARVDGHQADRGETLGGGLCGLKEKLAGRGRGGGGGAADGDGSASDMAGGVFG